jgi:hypothetical protein
MCTKIQEFVRRSIDLLIDRPIQCLFNRTGGIDRRNPGKAPKISFQECLYDLLKGEWCSFVIWFTSNIFV